MTSILLDTAGAIQWTSEKENKQYLNQLGGRDDQMMNQYGSKKDNQWIGTFKSIKGNDVQEQFMIQ